MSTPPAVADVDPPPTESAADPRAELHDAFGWLLLGGLILLGSITMDRLEQQGINKYTVPGLVPGLLGIAMLLLGTVLGVRSWRQRAHAAPRAAGEPGTAMRLVVVIILIVVFSVGLVGHGLPFWIAASIYVIASILILQAPRRAGLGRGLTLRDVAVAAAVGIGSGVVITYVFQELFLLRLP
ncbi:MAG: tripartite tricarboxylate transporter TctB family protein [Caldimonas sp.]